MNGQPHIVPVLLSGGAGSRLWPLSRESYPKQLLPLCGSRTMLQETALRAADRGMFGDPIVVANAEHRFLIAEQLRECGMAAQIVLEPFGRNTAAACATAALVAMSRDPESVLLIMPSDHLIRDGEALRHALESGYAAAAGGAFVLFGIRPDAPETGYGYIRSGGALAAHAGVEAVEAFVEKPDAPTAERYVADGRHYWNSGIFLLRADALIEEMESVAGEVVAACRRALERAAKDLDFLRLDADSLESCPSISLDHAVMEKTRRTVVVPTRMEWSDVGSWSSLWDETVKDADANAIIGDVVAHAATGCYVRGEGVLVAVANVDDLVVVATPDAVLVTRKDADQDVKVLVDRLKASGHMAAVSNRKVHRPWGTYEGVDLGERYQVKRITVKPGAKLSLQKHFHRAEHWVVVRGTALVTRDNEQILLRENESTYIPLGAMHRLENPGRIPLDLIEVQSGSYLGEDDIVRVDDIYARA